MRHVAQPRFSNPNLAIGQSDAARLSAIPADPLPFTALLLLAGHALCRKLQDRLNAGSSQEVDQFIDGHPRGFDQLNLAPEE